MNRLLALCILSLYPMLTFAQDIHVGEQTINFYDSSRNRPVVVEIWYPTTEIDDQQTRKTDLPFILPPTIRNATIADKKLPLIILSHGTGGNRFSQAWMAIELAQNGYIVAAPDHFGNTYDNKIPEYFVRYWERPLDISFILTSLLKETAFSGSINESRIGMAGFSLGGFTTLAIAGTQHQCELFKERANTKEGKQEFTIPEMGDLRPMMNELSCDEIPVTLKDDRIKVFIAMAPALGLGLPDEKQPINAPVLIFGAEADDIAPLNTNAIKYNKLIPDSKLITLDGEVGHYIFLNVGNEELSRVAKKYYRDDKSVDRAQIHDQVNAAALSFLQEHL